MCSAVTSGLPGASGSAHEEAKPLCCHGLVSWSRWGWTGQVDCVGKVQEGLLKSPRRAEVEGLEVEREVEGLQARKRRMKPM